MPYISIIIACRNAEPYVASAIRSALGQSFSDFEIVFVDDCSSDRSFEVAMALSNNDARVRVLKTERQSSAGATRNIAIANARGTWLAILDADDIFLPGKLEKQVELIRKADSTLILVGSGCFHIDPYGRRTGKYKYPVSSESLKKNLLAGRRFPPHSSILYRTSVVKNCGGFNEKFLRSEDCELCLRLSEFGNFACSSLPLVEYRIHSTNISNCTTDQGYSPIVYGTAARVCKMLKESGRIDPSDNQELLDMLLVHIENTIRASGYQEYIDWKISWKKASRQSIHSFDKLYVNGGAIVKSPLQFIRLLRERAMSSGMANKCFKSWIRLNTS